MLRASLDIGSHSILLLIADLERGRITPVHEEFMAPRLGESLAKAGRLSPEAMARAEADLRRALERSREMGVREIVAAGTAALREAENGSEFLARVRENLNLEIKILRAEEEASLSFLGALSALDISGTVAVLDVGGGSTELSIGEGSRLDEALSVGIGAVRLAERFGRSPGLNPVAGREIQKKLESLCASARGRTLIGVGGSVTTLASLKLGLRDYDSGRISATSISISDLDYQIEKFRSLSIEEIRQLPGMEVSRADIIEAGATIIRVIMTEASIGSMMVSDRGLRYGLLLH